MEIPTKQLHEVVKALEICMGDGSCTKCPYPGESLAERHIYFPETVSEGIFRNMSDNVNSPKHYQTDKFECIEVMIEIFGKDAVRTFCLLNAFKYLWRADKKNGAEDIAKAQWYINKYITLGD